MSKLSVQSQAAEHTAKASDRLIGSVVVTVPSAAWLWQQGPKKGEGHGHEGHDDHEEHHDDGEEESKDDGGADEEKPEGDDKDDGGDKDKAAEGGDDESKSADENKAESDDSGSEDGDAKDKDTPPTSDDEGGEDKPSPSAPKEINKPSGGKGPGETSEGSRPATEKKGEKDVSTQSQPTPFFLPSIRAFLVLCKATSFPSTYASLPDVSNTRASLEGWNCGYDALWSSIHPFLLH